MAHGNNPWLKLKEALRAQAFSSGFDAVGFAAPVPPAGAENFRGWLEQGRHGSMAWLEKNVDRRLDPRQLVPGVGVVVVLGINYRPPDTTKGYGSLPGQMQLSASCGTNDYHGVVKKRVQGLARWLEGTLGQPLEGRIFVDTAPVLEKPLAVAAGLGWQGKNTLLVSKKWGCWLVLGEYFLSLPLPPDTPHAQHCGTCRRCCDVCPTGALDGRGSMDARRCIAYFTMESSHPIPRECREAMGNRVVGCDDCLRVCPWNRFALPTRDPVFFPREDLSGRVLSDLVALDDAGFRHFFCKSSGKRAGRTRFLRNLAVALGNWGDDTALTGLVRLAEEPEALVRGAAVWGLGHIAKKRRGDGAYARAVTALAQVARKEQDPRVLEELGQVVL